MNNNKEIEYKYCKNCRCKQTIDNFMKNNKELITCMRCRKSKLKHYYNNIDKYKKYYELKKNKILV